MPNGFHSPRAAWKLDQDGSLRLPARPGVRLPHGRLRLHRSLSHRRRDARDRPHRPRVALARRQARAVHHSGRHADDADAGALRDLPRNARRQGGGARLPRRAGHAPADGRRTAQPARRRSRGRRLRRRIAHLQPRVARPGELRDYRRDPGCGDRASFRRSPRPIRHGVAQSPHLRLRPAHHLRPGLSARGGRLFRAATSISFPASPAPRSSTSRIGWVRSSPTTKSSVRATHRCAPSSTGLPRW